MSIAAIVKRHPVLAYFILTFLISWGAVLLAIGAPGGMSGTAEQQERLLPIAIVAMLLGPSFSGLLMTGIVSGRAGFREVLSRMRVWRAGARWYAIAVLTAPLAFMVVLLTLSLTSSAFIPGIFTASDKASLLLSSILAGLVVGFFEELGWTGFAAPRLRLRHSVLATALIIGVLWGAWHILTNDLWASGTTAGGLPLDLFIIVNGLGFLVGQLPAFRVLMVWVHDRTGSLLVAMLMHASLVVCTFALGPVAISGMNILIYDFALGVAMWVVVAVVAAVNRRQLLGKPLRR